MEVATASDSSQAAADCEQLCKWSLPDPEQKERIWQQITDIESQEPNEVMEIKMRGFLQRYQQLELMEPYFVKYFDVLGEIVEKRNQEFATLYMTLLSPAFMARKQEEDAFREYLRNPLFSQKAFFVKFLKS